MDASGVDGPVAVVTGMRPDLGQLLVRELLGRGYEVWASADCVPDGGAHPDGRVHRLAADADTDQGCEDVLRALVAVRRPVVAAAVGIAPGAASRLKLARTLHRFLVAWGHGSMLLVADGRDRAAWRSWRQVRREARALRSAERASELSHGHRRQVRVGTLLMLSGTRRRGGPAVVAVRTLLDGRDRVVRAGRPGP